MDNKVDHVWHVWINSRCGLGATDPQPDPPMRTMYDFKSAVSFMAYAPGAIKRAMQGTLPTVHQQCSHSKPEPIEGNVLQCWLGQDVTKCPILADLQACFDRERSRVMPDGRPSYYSTITDEDVYAVMGHVCTWHLLASSWAHDRDQLPPPRFVDWNEGAFQDKSDRMFWSRVYENLSESISDEPDEPKE